MLIKKTSDWAIALSVIVCSVVLFIALAQGLSGRTFVPSGAEVRVRFPDITGIKVSSEVKYSGASAGTVTAVRMLGADERKTDPRNSVEVTLRLLPDVPPLTAETEVSIAADTLLADKFVLLSDPDPSAPALAADGVLQGLAPVTFDRLVRNVDDAIDGVRRALGSGKADGMETLLTRAESVLTDTQQLVQELRPVAAEARVLVTDARAAAADVREILADNKTLVGDTLAKANAAAGRLDDFATSANRLVRENERPFGKTLADFRITAENLKVTSTYAKFLLNEIAARPSRLIWGGRPPQLPTEQEILRSSKPLPVE